MGIKLYCGLSASIIAGLLSISTAFAAATYNPEDLYNPSGTCARSYIYRNHPYPIDSSRKLDGEGLRPVLKKNPDAEKLLAKYQGQVKASFIPAYFGTLGLATALGGTLYADTLSTHLGRRDTKYAFLFSGIFMAISGYAYGQYALKSREHTLERAIETYNASVVEQERIQVDLKPTPVGDGGQVQTIVPF